MKNKNKKWEILKFWKPLTELSELCLFSILKITRIFLNKPHSQPMESLDHHEDISILKI